MNIENVVGPARVSEPACFGTASAPESFYPEPAPKPWAAQPDILQSSRQRKKSAQKKNLSLKIVFVNFSPKNCLLSTSWTRLTVKRVGRSQGSFNLKSWICQKYQRWTRCSSLKVWLSWRFTFWRRCMWTTGQNTLLICFSRILLRTPFRHLCSVLCLPPVGPDFIM